MVVCTCSLSYLGGWGRGITWTCEAEVPVTWDHATVLQPGDRARHPSQKKKSYTIWFSLYSANFTPSVSIVLPFPRWYVVGIIQYVSFTCWLLLLSNMYLVSFVSFHDLYSSFLFSAKFHCLDIPPFIHSPSVFSAKFLFSCVSWVLLCCVFIFVHL